MDTMELIMMSGVLAFGLGLLGIGAWFHINHERLKADPLLITSCYVWGAGLLLTNFAIPHLA